MGAMGNLFLNQSGGGLPNGPLRGVRRDPGTVYFAFKPGPDVIGQVELVGNHLCARHELAGSVRPLVLHLTICAIGYFPVLPEERVEAARGVAGRLVAKPFEIILNRARTYPNGKEKPPLVAFADSGVSRVDLFRYALIADLRRNGFSFSKKLPDPHMTLFYDHRVVAEEPIDPIRWVVRDFVLVHSIYGEGRHELLGRWPLRG
jgi:RNA 2',3'-cyclic 3'-phosphodiesterase